MSVDNPGRWINPAEVTQSGSYKFSGLPAGAYKIHFSVDKVGAVDQWYKNASSFDAATEVAVGDGQVVTGIDAKLIKGATISGKITASVGTNLEGMSVTASDVAPNNRRANSTARVAPDGTYKLTSLPAGSYKLQFSGYNSGALELWYKNASSIATATPVTVTAGQALTGINATLVKGATVSGKVAGPAGVDLSSVEVQAWTSTPRSPWGGASRLAEDGTYKIIGLPAGSYKLQFSAWNLGTFEQWYQNADSFETALSLTVGSGQDVKVANSTLIRGATISGKVTAPAGINPGGVYVDASPVASQGRGGGAYVAQDGSYKITGLQAGSYKLAFRAGSGGAADQWYAGAGSPATATAVTVASEQDLAGINVTLAPGASFSGKVTAPAGLVLRKTIAHGLTVAATGVEVFAAGSSAQMVTRAEVNLDGSYQVFGLPAGSYKVFVNSWNTGAADQWYNNAASFETARTLTVTAGEILTGIDPVLARGATLSGKVSGGAPGTPVSVLTTAGAVVVGGQTALDGTYRIDGLAAGSYKVAFNRSSGSSLAEAQFYNNKPEASGVSAAQTLTVGASQDVPDINATLVAGGRITGALTDKLGKPLPNTQVQAFTRDGSLITRAGATDASGRFSIPGLTTGKYLVVAQAAADGSRIYSGNATTEASATPVVAAVGKTTDIGTLSFGPAAPRVLAAPVPKVTGTAVSGLKLTAVAGAWGPAPVTLAYQWKRSGVAISGAKAATYVLTAADIGKSITVTVTGSKAGYGTAAKTSAATRAVLAPTALTAAPVPRITGTAVSRLRLTAVAGTWGPAPVSLTYQWKRSGVSIAGARAATYVLTSADIGKSITVTVTGSKAGYRTTAKTSAATRAVRAR